MSEWRESIFSWVDYRFEKLATPHSKQRGFRRDVISPQNGHILCDRIPTECGFSLRIQRSRRIVRSRKSRPKEMLIVLIEAFLLGHFRIECSAPEGNGAFEFAASI